MERDTVLAVDDAGEAVVYADCFNTWAPFVRPFAYLAVDPDHLDSVSCIELLTWAEDRAREDIPRAPSGSRFSLLGGVELKNTPVLEAWQAAGVVESRRFYDMRRMLLEIISAT